MNILSDKIIVWFDPAHNKEVGIGIGGKALIRPDMWLNTEAEEADAPSRFDENDNYLETNPQICTVMHPASNLPYKAGDKLFVHYMAWECRELTENGYVIDTEFIIFQIGGDLVKDTYLGEAVWVKDEEVSGFTVVSAKKDSLRVRLTHLPPNNHLFEIGDMVLSVDKNNYEFNYDGKRYIKLTRNEIVAKIYDKAS